MIKIIFNRIYGKAIEHNVNNDYIVLMLNYASVHRDIDSMNVMLSEYAILNPLT